MVEKIFTTENKNLTIRMIENQDQITLFWEGKCTLLYPSSFLTPIFQETLVFKKKIIMNFIKLDYITSSTFAPIIKLLNEIKAGEQSIELLYDLGSDWQEHNFSALSLFCTDDKRIQVLGIEP
jgi:hypothetical protein